MCNKSSTNNHFAFNFSQPCHQDFTTADGDLKHLCCTDYILYKTHCQYIDNMLILELFNYNLVKPSRVRITETIIKVTVFYKTVILINFTNYLLVKKKNEVSQGWHLNPKEGVNQRWSHIVKSVLTIYFGINKYHFQV